MADAKRFVCGSCRRVIEAWSDGNPYYLDRDGQKHYAYHPNHERLDRCIGNDLPHLCLACGEKFVYCRLKTDEVANKKSPLM